MNEDPLKYYNNLEEEDFEEIEEIVGVKHLDSVKDAVILYCIKKSFYDERPPIPELNEAAQKILEHSSAIIELLSDSILRDYLLGILVDDLDESKLKFIKKNTFSALNRTPELLVSEVLEDLSRVCDTAIKKQTPGRGRKKGSKDLAVHYLVNNLYRCCKYANDNKPLTNVDNNMLQRLIGVLEKPLDLGGKLPRIVREVIETNRNQTEKPLKGK